MFGLLFIACISFPLLPFARTFWFFDAADLWKSYLWNFACLILVDITTSLLLILLLLLADDNPINGKKKMPIAKPIVKAAMTLNKHVCWCKALRFLRNSKSIVSSTPTVLSFTLQILFRSCGSCDCCCCCGCLLCSLTIIISWVIHATAVDDKLRFSMNVLFWTRKICSSHKDVQYKHKLIPDLMCIYVYLFSFNIFNISPLKRITFFTGFFWCYLSASSSPSSSSSFHLQNSNIFFFLPLMCSSFISLFFLREYKNHFSTTEKNIQIFKFLIYLLSLFFWLFYYTFFRYLSHEKRLNARGEKRRENFYKLFQ